MSTWGEGNFDNDLAAEVLLRIVFQLLDWIKGCLEGEDRIHSLCGETEVMPSVDILLTLAKNYPKYVVPALRESPIGEWKIKYLNIFETHSEVPMDHPIQAERRSIILETFSELESLL